MTKQAFTLLTPRELSINLTKPQKLVDFRRLVLLLIFEYYITSLSLVVSI